MKNQISKALKGKVRTLIQHIYHAIEINGSIIKGEIATENEIVNYYEHLKGWDYHIIQHFNLNKQVVESLDYDQDGKIMNKVVYSYNNADLLVETMQYWSSDVPIAKTTFIYDKNGNLIEKFNYMKEDELRLKHIYNYNKHNQLVEEITFNKKNEIVNKISFIYNELDNIIEKKAVAGETIIREYKKYDDRKNEIEVESELEYMENDEKLHHLSKNFRKFDYNGNVLESAIYSKEGDLRSKNTYEYDENHNLIHSTGVIESKKALNYEWAFRYIYDEEGNWLQRIEYNPKTPVYIIEREIVYY